IRKLTGIDERFQDTRETPVVLGNHKNKFFGSRNMFLKRLKSRASAFIHIGTDKISRQIGKRKNMRFRSPFSEFLLIISGQFERITMGAVRAGYDGYHNGLN